MSIISSTLNNNCTILAKHISNVFPALDKKIAHKCILPLPVNHFITLIALNRLGTQSISELADHLAISKQQMSPIINKLLSTSLVKKEQAPTDRRTSNITLTNEGRKILEDHHNKMTEVLAQKVAVLSDDEITEFIEKLCRCMELLKKIP